MYKKKLTVLVAALSIATLSFAQSTRVPANRTLSGQQYHDQSAMAGLAPVAPATTTCAVSYSSGSGDSQVSYCVTVNGNVTQLSRAGNEMINVGTVDEGYGFCDLTTSTAYYDYGWIDSGNLLASTFTTPTLTKAVSTRITSDGVWQITNTITKVPAKTTAVGQVSIKMAIKNLTGISRSMRFLRHADVDADGTLTNDFDWTVNTASGQATGFGYGLSIVNDTFNIPTNFHNEYTLNNCCKPDPCNPFANISTQPFTGDGSVMSLYGFTVPKGGIKTITLHYQPI